MSLLAKVDVGAIKKDVQAEMNAEAVERAAEASTEAAGPADKAKPTLKTKAKGKAAVDGTGKASKDEVLAGIAEAMQRAETPNSFTEGQAVKLKADVKGPGGGMIHCKGKTATIVRPSGRKWLVSLPDPWPFPGTEAKPIEVTVDYTELEAVDA